MSERDAYIRENKPDLWDRMQKHKEKIKDDPGRAEAAQEMGIQLELQRQQEERQRQMQLDER